jgi:hypothetical protein
MVVQFRVFISDEGGHLFGGHAMNKENLLKMITGLSILYDKGNADKFRRNDGANKLRGRRVNLCQLMQPIVAQEIISDRMFQQQGFLARTLICRAESSVKVYQQINLSADPAMKRYWQRCRHLLRKEVALFGKQKNEVRPKRLKLSAEAKAVYIKFHDEIQIGLAPNGRLYPVKSFAAKAHDHALRIAATLAFFMILSASGSLVNGLKTQSK